MYNCVISHESRSSQHVYTINNSENDDVCNRACKVCYNVRPTLGSTYLVLINSNYHVYVRNNVYDVIFYKICSWPDWGYWDHLRR